MKLVVRVSADGIYSLGCCLYELMTLHAYVDVNELRRSGMRKVSCSRSGF